jgi:disulfide bond formation protein DsbB
MRKLLDNFGLYLAWLVAVTATAGSLYFSEVRAFVPCSLCWYQRIFMYPLVLILGLASFRQDKKIIPYVLPLSIVGGLIALWHVLEENIPSLSLPVCNVGVPCTLKYVNYLGFITIPVMSLTAFTLITLILFGVLKSRLVTRGPALSLRAERKSLQQQVVSGHERDDVTG